MSKLKVHTGEYNGYSPGAYYKGQKLAAIDINNSDDLTKWSSVLGLSEKELINAIKDFGPVIRDIRRGLLLSNDQEDDQAA